MTESPHVIAIAGMHRSGTSMFARFLHESGVDMGDRLHVDLRTNPYGHYEDLDFLELQRREIARALDGEDFLASRRFEPSAEFLAGAARLVERRRATAGASSWGWKDPRTTLFLPQWLELVPELHVVGLAREPRGVLSSLCRRLRAYFSIAGKERILRSYAHHNRCLDAFARQHPDRTSILSLERLIAEPEPCLAALSSRLGLELDPARFREHFDSRSMGRSRRALVLCNRSAWKDAVAVHARLLELAQ